MVTLFIGQEIHFCKTLATKKEQFVQSTSSCHFLAKSSEELDLSLRSQHHCLKSSLIPVRSVYGMFVSKHLLKKAVKIGGVGEGGGVRLDHGWGVLAQVAQVLLGHLHYHGK